MDYFNTRFSFDKRREIFWRVFSDYIVKKLKLNENDLSVADLGAGYCEFINNLKTSKKYAVDEYSDFKKICGARRYFIESRQFGFIRAGELFN